MLTIETLKELAKEIEMLKEKIENIDPSKDLASQGVDSLDTLSLLLLIQEKYGVQIPDEDIPKLETLNDIVEYVNRKLQEKEN
ncbi:MAG TPA: acyl carrier protein [Aquificales bacterium]|nr:acyl carrier protein [Aquificales bacterium]